MRMLFENVTTRKLSTECRKTKTKVIISANQHCSANHNKQSYTMTQSELEANTFKKRQLSAGKTRATETLLVLVLITFDWLRRWHEFYKPVTRLNKAKPNRITFDTQLKSALSYH